MIGKVFFMEFRLGWKGFLVFTLLVMLIAAGIAGLYPTVRDSAIEELEGEEFLGLEPLDETGATFNLSWEPVEGALNYTVLEDNRSSMVTDDVIYEGTDLSIVVTVDPNSTEPTYYAVLANINGSEPVLIGQISTGMNIDDPFAELINNPAYSGFTRGRELSFYDVKGFIAFEFFSWWWMLAGIFLGYISVSTVAGDFEQKRMDLIFSTPISRERYLLEKFLALSAFTAFVILVAAGSLASGIESIGMGDELSGGTILAALMTSLPMLMLIIAVGMLTGIRFQKTRIGMGITLLFIVIQFIIFSLSGFAASYEKLKYISMMNYWDYTGVIFDNTINAGHFVLLLVVSFVVLFIGMRVFKRMDIPA